MTPLLSHFIRNPSASPVDFCSETDLEYAQFSPPRCHTAISGLDDGSSLLPAPPASAQPQAPLQPLLPSQTEASNWTKVRSGPLPGTLLRLPPKSSQWPTGLPHLDPGPPRMHRLAPSPAPVLRHSGLSSCPHWGGCSTSRHLHLLVPCGEHSSPRFLNASVPHLLQASALTSPHPDHHIKAAHPRPQLGPGEAPMVQS